VSAYGEDENLIEYSYESGRLVRMEQVSEDGESLFLQYYEYAPDGRLLKWGEDYGDYERYWLYDYEETE
jgi:hypothetical protein